MNVTITTLAAGDTFAQIDNGVTEMSVLLDNPSDVVASLMASADSELKRAGEISRQAMVMRSAAWHVSKQRQALRAMVMRSAACQGSKQRQALAGK